MLYTYRLTAIATNVLTTGELISWPSPCGLNCSYAISFVGPAYQCAEAGPYSSIPVNLTELTLIATDASQFYIPPFINGSLWYWGVDDWGNGTRPVGLWIVYNFLQSTMRCILHSATYTTNVTYSNNVQSVRNTLELHDSIYNGSELEALSDTSADVNLLILDPNIWRSLNIFRMHEIIGNLLTGYITEDQSVTTDSQIGLSSFVDWSTGFPTLPDDFPTTIEGFMTNVTLSLLSLLNSDANVSVHALNISSKPIVEMLVPANVTSYPSTYAYSLVVLWQIYSTALGFGLICVVLGSSMLYTNGVTGQLSFSQVLVTTRNPTLDRISQGAELGGKYITDQVQKVKVRYGKLVQIESVGFGTEDEIQSLSKENGKML